jgi:Carboxypeptidase regulatory-like domain/TonB-dependent Receptor Plug Domain
MRKMSGIVKISLLAQVICLSTAMLPSLLLAQTGASTSIGGTVVDPSGAVVPRAAVTIRNPVSGFERTATTDAAGNFNFPNVPFNPYHLTVSAAGFASYYQDVEVRSVVPLHLNINLTLASASTTVTVEAEDLLEIRPTFHTDVERDLFNKLPLESQSSSVSSLVTLSSPGIAADSNGLFHGLGDHAENSFSVDGQPITDQQSKVFSNQIPISSIQSLEVISGAPPAEYGDKTSLVINVTTRSGLGATTPHGSLTAQYGTFGSSSGGFDLAYGGKRWGNFIAVDGLNTGRFLDPPEFSVIHAKGNLQNVFDRFDYQFSNQDSVRLNLGFTRSWFQTPNSFDQQNVGVVGPTGALVGPADQRSKILTFNIAPSWTRLISTTTAFTLGAFVRHDQYNYYPSRNPLADFGPIQRETVSQIRKLTNAGAITSLSYVKGIHNVKVGATYQQTFLRENFALGIVDPTLNAPCLDAAGNPVPGFTDPSQCAAAGLQPNIATNPAAVSPFLPFLACFDLTRPLPSPSSNCASPTSTNFPFNGRTDVKELGLYVQDAITWKNWSFNIGIRGDLYNGLSVSRQPEPRAGIAYNLKRTNTVLRASYARILETPFNENLVLSSTGCNFPVIAALIPCVPAALEPGFRNEFHAGLQQAFGKYFVLDGDYLWKYTRNGYDFSVLGNTPITFPIEWHNSKITGVAVRGSMPDFHGLTAFIVLSSVAARFFTPQIGGLGVVPTPPGSPNAFIPFRIDHDEIFNQTTHLQYQPKKGGPWFGFSWRYDSGLVAGAVPCFGVGLQNSCPQSTFVNGQPAIILSGLTADQQFQAGLTCPPGVHATPTTPLPAICLASQFGSTLVQVPSPGAENDDHNPPRIAPRNLFDIAVGHDNIFHGDRYKWSVQIQAINLTNEFALYNFLSTFSGTHYVSPRTINAQIGFHF